MKRSHILGRLVATAALAVGTVSAIAFTPGIAQAAGPPPGSYGGSASGDIVHLAAVTVPGTFQAADVHVAPSNADVDSSGTTITAAPKKGAFSYARAANLDVNLLSGSTPFLNGLIVEAKQQSLPDNKDPNTANLLSVPAAPLLNATVADASAHTHWLGAQCVPPGTPIAQGISDVATATALPGSPIAISVVNAKGGPVFSQSTVGLVKVKNSPNLGVQSDQIDQVTGVVLFKGTANELTINVLAPPEITAVASGLPTGSSVTYTEPILQVLQGTTVIGTLDAASANLTIPGSPLLSLSLGTLNSTVAKDGTSAKGSADLLDLQVGVLPASPIQVAEVAIAPSSVSAFVPSGGVVCPPPVNPFDESHKDASAAAVAPGQQFNYTVTVPNRSDCQATKVKVVDTITGPNGFTVVSTDPKADSVSGNVVTWNDIGPIDPNQTKNLTITLQAPPDQPDGFQWSNHAEITGIGCGQDFKKDVDIQAPRGFTPAAKGCFLDNSNKQADHTHVFAGESFNYYIRVFNSGKEACDNVTVTDPDPANTTFVAASAGGNHANGSTTWDLGTLAPGESRELVLTVIAGKVANGTHLPDVATIASSSENHSVMVTAEGPQEDATSVLASPLLPEPGGPQGQLPRTGGLPLAPYGLGLLVLALGVRGWRRRMRLAS